MVATWLWPPIRITIFSGLVLGLGAGLTAGLVRAGLRAGRAGRTARLPRAGRVVELTGLLTATVQVGVVGLWLWVVSITAALLVSQSLSVV